MCLVEFRVVIMIIIVTIVIIIICAMSKRKLPTAASHSLKSAWLFYQYKRITLGNLFGL